MSAVYLMTLLLAMQSKTMHPLLSIYRYLKIPPQNVYFSQTINYLEVL